jgi:hypothetical protein
VAGGTVDTPTIPQNGRGRYVALGLTLPLLRISMLSRCEKQVKV